MRLYIRGRSRSLSQEETRRAVKFFVEQALGPRLAKNVKIFLEWRRYPGEKGHCEWRDQNAYPREFSIGCNPDLKRPTALKTLAHEVWHVEQMARGRLMDCLRDSRFSRWKKRVVDEERVPYSKLPWEREAYKMEERLYRRYVDFLKKEAQRHERE